MKKQKKKSELYIQYLIFEEEIKKSDYFEAYFTINPSL